MSVAGEFFAERDLNRHLDITTADDLWNVLREPELVSFLAHEPFSRELIPGRNLFFRGQPNSEYALSSKLYRDAYSARRRLAGATSAVMQESDLFAIEADLISQMRAEGIGRRMTDGQLLAVLQHHGIATRLIDVSETPLEALFFAVDKHPDKDGRLFVIHPHTGSALSGTLKLSGSTVLPWSLAATRGKYRSTSDWTNSVAAVTDASLDPRMHAQRGRFLVGGLNRRYAGNSMTLAGSNLPAASYIDVSTLNINFLRRSPFRPNLGWGATGWCFLVKAAWKAQLLDLLAGLPDRITSDSMYPPLTEVSRLARRTLERKVAELST